MTAAAATTADTALKNVLLDDLHPHPGNVKRHDLPLIRRSISRFGFNDPVVVDQRTDLLAAGHGRRMALLGMRDDGRKPPAGITVDGEGRWLVPTFTGWASRDDLEAEAAMLALNRSTDKGGYDEQGLVGLLDRLAVVQDGLDGVGYEPQELDELRARLASLEAPNPWKDRGFQQMPSAGEVERGQLWRVGEHLLTCGDSRDPGVWTRMLGDSQGHLMFTDPPYGIDYDGGGVERERLAGDGADEAVPLLHDVLAAVMPVLRRGAGTYVCLPSGEAFLGLARELDEVGLYRWMLVWVKDRQTFGRADYHPQHEAIVYGWVPGAHRHALADRKQTTVWQVDRPTDSDRHPTAKPPELAQRAIRNSTDLGQIVIEPFAGSGSTLVAAHREGRVGVGCEWEPGYVKAALDWLAAETGSEPVLLDMTTTVDA